MGLSRARFRSWLKSELWTLSQDLRRFGFGFLANTILGSPAMPRRLRTLGYRCLGMDVALDANIWPRVLFVTRRVTIGKGAAINSDCRFENVERVHLHDGVFVGPGAVFITSTHALAGPEQRAGAVTHRPISVQTGAWVGAGALLLPGVVVGAGSVIGAGSVVTKDVAGDVLAVGAPAREVRSL